MAVLPVPGASITVEVIAPTSAVTPDVVIASVVHHYVPNGLIRGGVNSDKGFGFIRDLDSGESIFAHVTNMKEEVDQGDKVTFEVEMSHKGPSAIKVTIVK